MLVKKYQGQSLDEALKAVKADLGIEAVILKTEKFKGLKGALSHKRYEVTAGLEGAAQELKEALDTAQSESEEKAPYINKKITSNLVQEKAVDVQGLEIEQKKEEELSVLKEDYKNLMKTLSDEKHKSEEEKEVYLNQVTIIRDQVELKLDEQNEVISKLREEIKEIRSELSLFEAKKESLSELKENLKSFDLSESLVHEILNKLRYEVQSEADLSLEQINEIVVREISRTVKIAPANFTLAENKNKPFIIILVSSGCSGQTSMTYKMSQFSDKSHLIEFGSNCKADNFKSKLLDLSTEACTSLQSLVKSLNKQYSDGKHIFVDLNALNEDRDETKRIIQAIKSSFENVEVILNLSSIHSETYNLKESHKFGDVIDSISVSFLDHCLNLISLANLQCKVNFPYNFFGNGPVIPKDIEEANRERILSEIFDL